jgi:hypothetical protein
VKNLIWLSGFLFLLSACMAPQKIESIELRNPPDLILGLPFSKETQVVCTYSGGSGRHDGTHLYANAYWAIDLSTSYDQPAATVLASAPGLVYVLQDSAGEPCEMKVGSPRFAPKTNCGNGWGNRVKVLHQGGYFTLYAHLQKVLVKDGARVAAGDPIGIEGWTGYAGHRHLHWGLQKLNCIDEIQCDLLIKNLPGESVPFEFRTRENGVEKTLNTRTLKCSDSDSAVGTKKFSGIY